MSLASITNDVVLLSIFIILPLAPCGTEVAFLAFSSASHARRFVGVVDTA